jgi:hypothetical protein
MRSPHILWGMRLALAALISVGAPLSSARAQQGPAGHWEGAIKTPGQEMAIVVDLGVTAEKWQGTIAIPSQNVKGFPLSDIAVKDSSVSFSMKGVPGEPRFAGTVSTDGKSIAGEFTQGGATIPFALAWKSEAKLEAPPKSTAITKELEGSWEGALNVNGTVLRLILKLTNTEGGATGSIVSVDQGGAEIGIASITQTASRLQLNVSAIGAAYDGELKDGQLTGTWTQGPGSWPLVFKPVAK